MEPVDDAGPSGSAQQAAQGVQEEGAGAREGARFRSGLKDDCFDSESEPQLDAAGAAEIWAPLLHEHASWGPSFCMSTQYITLGVGGIKKGDCSVLEASQPWSGLVQAQA